MTDNRCKILVETFYSRETNRLELTKKDVEPQDNTFFIQILCLFGGYNRLTVRVENKEISETTITKRELMLLQDTIRDVLDNPGKAKVINLGGEKIQILHFESGEIGFGIGLGKYLLEETDATLLREFCVKVM